MHFGGSILDCLLRDLVEKTADGCMGATEFAPKMRKRYQTNELAVDSTEFGDQGVGGSNPLSPTNLFALSVV
jgi:hypothetical protein